MGVLRAGRGDIRTSLDLTVTFWALVHPWLIVGNQNNDGSVSAMIKTKMPHY